MQHDKYSQALGRGLDAILGSVAGGENLQMVPLVDIHPSIYQPRQIFSEKDLTDLSLSIKEKGVLQPLLLRQISHRQYEIVAGERRWRASQIAGLHEVPAIVKKLSDVEVLEIALIENVQRKDLSAIEEARAYERLMNEFGYTQEQLSKIIGKSRSHIANTLRLLSLPESVHQLLDSGQITAGHARALLSAPDAETMAHRIVSENMNVRQAEECAKNPKGFAKKTEDVFMIECKLQEAFKRGVYIQPKGDAGEIKFTYRDAQDLDRLIHQLIGEWR
jgi:ParB family chromosome partitioning protein